MNKAELIDAVHARCPNMSKSDAERALNAVIDAVQGAVAGGEKVALPGFGTFAPSQRAERMGRNPRTGEVVKIPASKGVKFTAGAKFKAQVQGA